MNFLMTFFHVPYIYFILFIHTFIWTQTVACLIDVRGIKKTVELIFSVAQGTFKKYLFEFLFDAKKTLGKISHKTALLKIVN